MSKFELKVSSRLLKKKIRKQSYLTPKHCRFCGSDEQKANLDYKNVNLLRIFLTERNKILPQRVSGNRLFHQRMLATQIKVSRSMALLPFCSMHV